MFLLPFSVVGVSHETNAEQLVGRARRTPEQQAQLLASLRERDTAAVLLSTCHRTELYWWGDEDLEPWFVEHVLTEHVLTEHVLTEHVLTEHVLTEHVLTEHVLTEHVLSEPCASGQLANATIERRTADLAVRHLFAVAAGMHSRRFGEPEVLGQVRQAWRTAQHAQTTSADLDIMFRQAIDAARHIRLAIGSLSQASLGACARGAIDAHARVQSHTPVRVLVVGAGDVARSVLDAFASPDASSSRFALAVTSRTDARAEHIASEFRVTPVSWSARASAMCAADVVVFAAHSSTPLVHAEHARAIAQVRRSPSLWIDLGVPGNVHRDVAVAHVRIVRLSDLEGQQPHDRAAHARASSALQRELARFSAATQRRRLGAQLADLEHRALCAVRDAIGSAHDNSHAEPPAEAVARRVTRVLLRELSALQ